MKTSGKPFLAMFLSLLLVLTGQSAALARGENAAVGQMVICAGGQMLSVYMDVNGQPTAPPHLCPDCVVSVIAAPFQSGLFAPRQLMCLPYSARAGCFLWKDTSHPGFLSRAPPVSSQFFQSS